MARQRWFENSTKDKWKTKKPAFAKSGTRSTSVLKWKFPYKEDKIKLPWKFRIQVKIFLESENQVKVYFKLWTEKVGWREVAAGGGKKEVPSEEKTSKRKYANLKEILIL